LLKIGLHALITDVPALELIALATAHCNEPAIVIAWEDRLG
jgi:hypothetical protein